MKERKNERNIPQRESSQFDHREELHRDSLRCQRYVQDDSKEENSTSMEAESL